MKRTLLALALGVVSINAFAAAPSWDYVQAGYVSTDFDDADIDFKPSGFSLSGAKLLGENVFVTGTYSQQSDDIFGVDIDLDMASLGLGYRYGLTQNTDFFGVVSYENIEISGAGESEDDNGYGLTAGVRSIVTDSVELRGAIRYLDIADDGDTFFVAGADYFFSPQFAIGVSYETSSDLSFFNVNARYNF